MKNAKKVTATAVKGAKANDTSKVKAFKKTVEEVNSGAIPVNTLTKEQKQIINEANIATGKGSILPTTKAAIKKAAKATAAETVPASHEAEIDALVNEVNETAAQTPKRRAPKGEIITPKKEDEKAGKPWSKFGAHGTNSALEGFTAGDQVMFNLKGAQTQGTYSHFHINNHSPKGYLVIKVGNKIFERTLAKVTKVAAPAVEAAKPVIKSGSTTKERENLKLAVAKKVTAKAEKAKA
jgi:hypothetical protein